jgi:hypothetical protein
VTWDPKAPVSFTLNVSKVLLLSTLEVIYIEIYRDCLVRKTLHDRLTLMLVLLQFINAREFLKGISVYEQIIKAFSSFTGVIEGP